MRAPRLVEIGGRRYPPRMHIADILSGGTTSLSFEFFPPKTDSGFEALYRSIAEFEPLAPSFVSVTYGAGGSTRGTTLDVLKG